MENENIDETTKEHEETTEETTETDESTTSGDESTEESSTSTSSDEASQKSQESTDSPDDEILSADEIQRRENLLSNLDEKERLDAKSQIGRIEKQYNEKIAELSGVITAMKAVNSEDNGNSDTASNDNADSEPNFHTPSQPFLNDDGSLNEEGLSEWNYLSSQKLYQKVLEQEKQIKELGGDVTSFQETEAQTKAGHAFQQRYGLSQEVFQNYNRIKNEKGEFDAIEYLEIEKKEKQGIDAARAHRDNQRQPAASFIGSGSARMSPSADENPAENVAKEILSLPRGDKRNAAIQSVPFNYPSDISSQILRLVVDQS